MSKQPFSGVISINAHLAASWTCSPSSELLDRFMVGYDRAFTLPSEKETREGFQACLSLNYGPAHTAFVARFGDYFEAVLILECDGELVGGANMLAYRVKETSMYGLALNYAFVDQKFRRQGHLTNLLDVCRQLASSRLGAASNVFVFLEMNNPDRMSPENYLLDSQVSGLDQHDRLDIWRRQGARIIDFPYVQPALSDDQLPDESLFLAVIPPNPATDLSSSCLKSHLERFFEISVLKGAPEPDIVRLQLSLCDAVSSFAFLAPSKPGANLVLSQIRVE